MLLTTTSVSNSVPGKEQFEAVTDARNAANKQEQMFVKNGMVQGNAGLVPRHVYQDFDSVTVERMRSDDGDTFLNDLMPLSRSVSIGKLISRFRRASDAGVAQASMSGQSAVAFDQVEYKYDGSLVPIYDAGFGRNWREWAAQQSEGFDALIDDQRETVAALRRKIADSFLDGHKDRDGNTLSLDGITWTGMRNDSRVNQVDLGGSGISFDFTDNSKTGEENKAAFIALRNVLWIDNNVAQEATYYISREIAASWEHNFSSQYDAKTIMAELNGLMGVKDIKVSSKLVGNELMAMVLDSNSIKPLVGMGITTVEMPRQVYNSDYRFTVWGAIGWEIRSDFSGNSACLFAQAIS